MARAIVRLYALLIAAQLSHLCVAELDNLASSSTWTSFFRRMLVSKHTHVSRANKVHHGGHGHDSRSGVDSAPPGSAGAATGGSWADVAHQMAAAPWLLPPEVRPPYDGLHQDLDSLLKVQAPEGRVSLTLYTVALHDLLLNWVYTLVTFGHVRSFVVATVDDESLMSCLSLRLPCWDASGAVEDALGGKGLEDPGKEKNWSSEANGPYHKLMHAKPDMVEQLMDRGLDLHFSDIDVAFVRNVWASVDRLLSMQRADGTFMREHSEDPDQRINTGHYALLHNERTVAMVKAWAAKVPEKYEHATDQQWLNSPLMRTKTWDLCGSEEECRGVSDLGRAAIYAYAEQGNAKVHGHCIGREEFVPCADWHLALHYICLVGGIGKVGTMMNHGVWYYGEGPTTTPISWFEADIRSWAKDGNEIWQHRAGLLDSHFLPCPDPVAKLEIPPR